MLVSASGESLVTIFNELFTRQYETLTNYARQDKDLLHKNYLKIVERFNNLQQFTAQTTTMLNEKILAYTKSSIYNTFKTENTLKKKNIGINYETEIKLQETESQSEDDKLHQQEIEYVTQKLFEYTKKHYDESSQYVFKVYYLYNENNKKITYRELSEITGYSLSKVAGIVQRIKNDLKVNLIPYINGNTRD